MKSRVMDLYQRILDSGIENSSSVEEFLKKMDVITWECGQRLELGKWEAVVSIPGNQIIPRGEKGKHLMYQWDGELEIEPLVQEFETSEKGKVKFLCYPRKDCILSEEQILECEMIQKLLFVTGGRSRISILLKHALQYDLLTGIPNQELFFAFMRQIMLLRNIENYNAYFINCKNFKYINKNFGYKEGDAVLRMYAQKIEDFCNKDELIARLGGDNFIAIVRRERHDEFLKLLKGVEIEIRNNIINRIIKIAASVGYYEIRDLKDPKDIMLPIATAVQAAKQDPMKNYIQYTPEIAKKIGNTQKIYMEFSEALKKGELVTYLQPKCDLKTGKICGAEALARWVKDDQIVSPAQFVPALEKNGLICDLDFEILRQICRQISSWCKRGIRPPRISFNLSRWHLHNPNIVNDVKTIMEAYGVGPEYLEVELTETGEYEEYEIIREVFHEFNKEGIATTIDDFGIGYSSMMLVVKMDVDVLKLDRSLIKDIPVLYENEKERIVLSNIVRMAKELNLEVVAEGVETEAQCQYLRQIGCQVVQGFYFHKPMPVEQFQRLIS